AADDQRDSPEDAQSSFEALRAYFCRIQSRIDKAKAVKAVAHKLALLTYSMLNKGEAYTDQGQAYCEERYRQRVLHNLNRRAQQLGMTLVPTAPAAQAA
ncbi:MAG: hypothetical protein ACKO1K_04655, partial [Burkholderiales bacterium]